jgi:hypothetical protein
LIAPAAQASIAECERVVKEYEALPRGGRGRASARGLSADAAGRKPRATWACCVGWSSRSVRGWRRTGVYHSPWPRRPGPCCEQRG